MGYYTKHNLQITPVFDSDIPDIINELKEKELLRYAFDEDYDWSGETIINFPYYDEQKWYSKEQDMTGISKKFPNFTFRVICDGEDGSSWIDYYKNGKHELCYGRTVYDKPTNIIWPE